MALIVSSFIISGAILCAFLSIVMYHVRRFRLYKFASKFPGPTALPIVGNGLYFVGSNADILAKSMWLDDNFPSPFRLWVGNRLWFSIHDAEQLKAILLSPKAIEKGDLYEFCRPLLGTGLLTAPETAMGVSIKAQTESSCRYVDCARGLIHVTFERMLKIWLHPDIIFNRTKLAKDQRECLKYLHEFTNDVIQKKKKHHSKETERVNSDQQQNRKAFLDLLMELSDEGTKFSDEELRQEVDTMTIAGNDTTASVSCFTILMLAMYQDIQDKVYEELCEIYGEDDTGDTLVSNEDLHKMVYLERVIKETMRLFPVGPYLLRRITEDLNIGEHTLPGGSTAVIAIIKVHRSEEYWTDPLKFDPDRFLPEESSKRHPYCYLPFSAGPRNCIGMRYAMMSMKSLLATILRRYVIRKDNIVPIEDIKLKQDIVLKPLNPIMIRIEKRNNYM